MHEVMQMCFSNGVEIVGNSENERDAEHCSRRRRRRKRRRKRRKRKR